MEKPSGAVLRFFQIWPHVMKVGDGSYKKNTQTPALHNQNFASIRIKAIIILAIRSHERGVGK